MSKKRNLWTNPRKHCSTVFAGSVAELKKLFKKSKVSKKYTLGKIKETGKGVFGNKKFSAEFIPKKKK